ncbi:MAG TPA: YaaL family protein [Tissierellia bacterium]|nr:YaaL family protein [Tissierellia bacterium]
MNSIRNKISLKSIFQNFKIKQDIEKDEMFMNIEKAKKEWEDAKNIFENVSHPDLVDYAIYKIEAAEQKYIYLLKQYRNGNL